jgi:hypothetical protein
MTRANKILGSSLSLGELWALRSNAKRLLDFGSKAATRNLLFNGDLVSINRVLRVHGLPLLNEKQLDVVREAAARRADAKGAFKARRALQAARRKEAAAKARVQSARERVDYYLRPSKR